MPHHVRNNRHAMVRACAGSLLLLSQQALGATDPDSNAVSSAIASVVVSDTRPKAALHPNLPATIERITARQLETRNVINTEDALKYLPNMAVRKRFIGDENATISVRGNGTSQTARSLVYADGLLLSNFLGNTHSFPPRWSMVFPEDVAQVDVVYGPYSALYPGNSMGATVVISTKMPTRLEATLKSQIFSQQFHLFGVDDHYDGNKSTASVGNRIGKFAFLIGADHLNNTGQPLVFASQPRSTVPAGAAARPVSGAHLYTDANGAPAIIFGVNGEGRERVTQDQFKFKASYDLTPELQAALTYGYWRQSVDNHTASDLRDGAGNPVAAGLVNLGGYQYNLPNSLFAPAASKSENQLFGLSLKSHYRQGWNYFAVISDMDVVKNIARSASSGLPAVRQGSATDGQGTGWTTLDMLADYRPPAPGAAGHWPTIGYHYDHYQTRSTTRSVTDWLDSDSAQGEFANSFRGATQTRALFAQDAWRLDPQWKLTAGLRYEQWRAFDGARATATSAQDYAGRSMSAWSPKAALAFQAAPALLLRAAVGRAYRFPTVSELFQGSLIGTALVNNDPNLRPEKDLSKEVSAEWQTERGMLRSSLFEDDVRDTLFSQTNTTVFPNVTNIQNIDRVRTRGAELAYTGENLLLRGLEVDASLGYTRAIILENGKAPDTVGNKFYRIPLWRANLAATYRFDQRLTSMLGARYSGRQYNTLTNTDIHPGTFGGTSNFLVFDSKFTFKPTARTEVGLGIDNLTDRRYYVYYPYPGRTVYLEAKVSL